MEQIGLNLLQYTNKDFVGQGKRNTLGCGCPLALISLTLLLQIIMVTLKIHVVFFTIWQWIKSRI